jgi:hypothetical protein
VSGPPEFFLPPWARRACHETRFVYHITSLVCLCLFVPNDFSADGASVILGLHKGKDFPSTPLNMHNIESTIRTLSLASCFRELNRELRVFQGIKYTRYKSLSIGSLGRPTFNHSASNTHSTEPAGLSVDSTGDSARSRPHPFSCAIARRGRAR